MKGNSESIVLAGFESAGKSALFRGLTREASGDEANFRGSTVVCRTCYSVDCSCHIVDTPGIRLDADTETTRLALGEIGACDAILLVVRGTDVRHELESLLSQISDEGKRVALAITFADKAPAEIERLAGHYREVLGIPVVAVDARELSQEHRTKLLAAAREARRPKTLRPASPRPAWRLVPDTGVFERPISGGLLAVVMLGLLWALPVMAAFQLAGWIQPFVDRAILLPLTSLLTPLLPPLLTAVLIGDYGLLTLGSFSFLWAFPVVLFIGSATAICEQSGLLDRITRALDPLMRRFGLSGRDLLPILTGFGCNVVAVRQSRACSRCTRKTCVSAIAFGSACSYQIGATLSVLGASGHGVLFAPYLALLLVAGLVHARLWNGPGRSGSLLPASERSFLQWPAPRAVWWKVKSVTRGFLLQAMPIFLLICVAAALLEFSGALGVAARFTGPVLEWLSLPAETAPALVFSILRKDGLLLLNQGEGALAATLAAPQIFLLVWIGGTFSACLVTLWTIRAELGQRTALVLAARQAATCLAVTFILSLFFLP